jgi:hypothetical protein
VRYGEDLWKRWRPQVLVVAKSGTTPFSNSIAAS